MAVGIDSVLGLDGDIVGTTSSGWMDWNNGFQLRKRCRSRENTQMPLEYLGATRGEMGDELGAQLQGELTCHRRRWGRQVSALGTDGFASCPNTLRIRIHVCGSGDKLERTEKVTVRPDLPARGAVSCSGEPERPREQTDDGLDSCPGMLSVHIYVQGDVGNLRRPVKLSVTLNLPCINERSVASNSNTLENASVTP